MQVPLSHMTSRSAAWHMLHTMAACVANDTQVLLRGAQLIETDGFAFKTCTCTGSPAVSRCIAPGHQAPCQQGHKQMQPAESAAAPRTLPQESSVSLAALTSRGPAGEVA